MALHRHAWQELHHVDDQGRHWCPTGFELCNVCGATREAKRQWLCRRWGAT